MQTLHGARTRSRDQCKWLSVRLRPGRFALRSSVSPAWSIVAPAPGGERLAARPAWTVSVRFVAPTLLCLRGACLEATFIYPALHRALASLAIPLYQRCEIVAREALLRFPPRLWQSAWH